jgi:hypothetical protein
MMKKKNTKSHAARPTPPDLDELIRALETARDSYGDAEGLTVRELARRVGHGMPWVRERLLALQQAGRLRVGRAMRPGLNGVPHVVWVYSLQEEEEKR